MKPADQSVDKPPVQATTGGYKTFEDLQAYQLLNGYIRWLRERKQGSSSALHESSPAYGLTEDELDAILTAPEADNAPPASTLQRFNASTNP